jgi:hypothetical protein
MTAMAGSISPSFLATGLPKFNGPIDLALIGSFTRPIHDLQSLGMTGEAERRLYSLDAWRECPDYSERERAALEWTEAVTLVTDKQVPDEVYQRVRAHFAEKELADLTLTVAAINAWNRLSIAARLPAGTYNLHRRRPDLARDGPVIGRASARLRHDHLR